MSKSIGNIVEPMDLIRQFNSEAFRYYFMSQCPFNGDGEFSFERFAAETYLAQRRSWLDAMLDLGAEALTSGASGDPLELRTTYFQEFLAGGRT
jgi:leucyl-tRNA synthetase